MTTYKQLVYRIKNTDKRKEGKKRKEKEKIINEKEKVNCS